MADGTCQMAEDKWKMANGTCQMAEVLYERKAEGETNSKKSAERGGLVHTRVTHYGGWGRRPMGITPRGDTRFMLPSTSQNGTRLKTRRSRIDFLTILDQISSLIVDS